MTRTPHRFVASAAVAAWFATVGVAPGWGQAPSAGQGGAAAPQAAVKAPAAPGTAAEHLAKARSALDGITGSGFTPEAAGRLRELKTRFAEMEKSYKDMGVTRAAAEERRTGTRFTITKTGTWSSFVGDVDRLAGELLGFPLKDGSRIQLAEPAKGQVQAFRGHLTSFALAADGTAGLAGKTEGK